MSYERLYGYDNERCLPRFTSGPRYTLDGWHWWARLEEQLPVRDEDEDDEEGEQE